ncbi:hypothetical protein AAHA92_21765 [Salvia divinorum]|uniref:Uncharacterized protein n=1 Tax=Salvia divinorum TaxID=28513 RepID=A0ABD1GMQ7_SALDI
MSRPPPDTARHPSRRFLRTRLSLLDGRSPHSSRRLVHPSYSRSSRRGRGPASTRSCSLARIAVVVRRQSEEIAKFLSKRAKNHC